jgi:hypothetical protein
MLGYGKIRILNTLKMGISRFKNFLFVYGPIVFILSIWLIFSFQYIFQDKVPFPSTYQVNNFAPWSAYEKFWGPVKNAAMPDIITQIYPWRHLAVEIWKSGNIPLWNHYSFSGTPLLANYQSAVLSPFNLLFFIFPFVDGWTILVLLQPLLAGFFTYLFARSIKISKIGSVISSISFMFCGFITTWMGYATLGYAILFLPLALFCIEKYWDSGKLFFLSLFSLTFPLSFFSGHFQISTYFILFICLYLAYKFILTRNIHNALYLILYTFFGLLLIMPQVLPSMDLYFQSFRSSFFQTGFISLQYVPTLIVPDFFGNPVTRNTWFGHYAEWNGYIGLPGIFLAFLAFFKINKKILIFLFIGLLSLILATENFISSFILGLNIPLLSQSAIGRIIVLYSFSFAVLAGFGFDSLVEYVKHRNTKKIFSNIGIFTLFFVVLWSIVAFGVFIEKENIGVSRQNLILPTLLFLGLCISVVIGVFYRGNRIYNKIIIFTIGLSLLSLTSFDMLRFSLKWMPSDPKNFVFPDIPSSNAFKKISGFDRVLGNLGGEANIYYRLPSVEGYDALYSRRYGQFVNYIESEKLIISAWSVVDFPNDGKFTSKALDFLGIKYIAHKVSDNEVSWTFPYWKYPEDRFKRVYKDDKYEFYENKNVFPRAFLVSDYTVANSSEQALKKVFDDNFDLRSKVVLEKDPKMIIDQKVKGEVKITSFESNSIKILSRSNNNALLVLANNYNSGWKAKINNREIPILRANHAFSAIPVEKGESTVVLEYDPFSFRLGIYLFLSGVSGIVIFLFVSRSKGRLKPFFFWQSGIGK